MATSLAATVAPGPGGSPAPTLPPASAPESVDESEGGRSQLRTGAVVAIVAILVGGAAVAVGLAVVGGLWLRRRRQ
jgi:hypothetical protein